MIGRLRGTLVHKALPAVVLDVGGVGYEVRLSLGAFEGLPAEGGTAAFEVVTLFRNEALELYGFASAAEKQLFGTLLGVSGVGPKTALALVSALPVREVVAAVQADRPQALERVPGIGRKTAQRLVLELKDRVETLVAEGAVPAPAGRGQALTDDALAALENLGYRRAEADAAVRATHDDEPDAELAGLIRGALRRLGQRR